jgi:DNA-directed RNA polymerase subunit RPC12/RpoP
MNSHFSHIEPTINNNNLADSATSNTPTNHNNKKGVYKCETCGKLYKSKENKILHYKNVHLGQKPYKCSYCSSRFSHRNGKIYHERRFHTRILPYLCPFISECNEAFPTKSALRYHVRTKHKGTLNYNDKHSDNNNNTV